MRAIPVSLIAASLSLSMLTFGCPCLTSLALAEETDSELVPEPWVQETHEYDVWLDVDGVETHDAFVNERSTIEIRHGDMKTLIMARNITEGDATSVDYQNNIHYYIGGVLYIAQFTIMEVVFDIGEYEVSVPLRTCSDFEVEHTPVVYDGTVPTLDCNFFFEGLHIYQDGSLPAEYSASTVDLTLIHRIRADWNDTSMKVEAVLDFADTRFYDPNDGHAEFETGEQFTAKIWYTMGIGRPGDPEPVIPTSCTNSTLEYNITLDNGIPLTMSQLNMDNNFTAYDSSGPRSLVGYSSMEMGEDAVARVWHGFPNMTYGETTSMQSDPEVTVFHDTVTEAYRPFSEYLMNIIPFVAAAVAAIAVVFILWRRKRSAKNQ